MLGSTNDAKRILMFIAMLTLPVGTNAQQGGTPESSKPVLTFESDTVLVTLLIEPDKTADFELVLSKLKEALANSPKPERKAQAAGRRVFRGNQSAQGNAVYIMQIEPVVKGQEYDITRLIAEVFPVEVQALFPKYRDAFAGRSITELTPLLGMHP
jgi:hypothetical protein